MSVHLGLFHELIALLPFSIQVYCIFYRGHSLVTAKGLKTRNHVVCKSALNILAKLSNLAKCLGDGLQTQWLWV